MHHGFETHFFRGGDFFSHQHKVRLYKELTTKLACSANAFGASIAE